ncbi:MULTISPECIES: hypothetical protein [unclassified Streptomyces]|uniref:hypothetical protein n=1 Tax=unclassified Streptomyces TaxID=2593676 RepID=UPI00093BFEEE|nr:hypothetical protein [Streptomyces sp. CB01883]OKJ74453.1 hypothetical protein AMK32_36405 [Streptomyces sp. CB01883]
MQIAGVDLYVNHPVMAFGSTEWIPTTLALDGAPAAACDTHVITRVQAQVVLVKVRVFRDHGDADDHGGGREPLTTVFDGHLLLSDGRLVVGDVAGESRFTTSLLGKPGRRRVRVSVDDPHGWARAVDVVISGETV